MDTSKLKVGSSTRFVIIYDQDDRRIASCSAMNDGRLWFTDAMGNDAVMSAEEREAIERTGRGSWERYRFEDPTPKTKLSRVGPLMAKRRGKVSTGSRPSMERFKVDFLSQHQYHLSHNGRCPSRRKIPKGVKCTLTDVQFGEVMLRNNTLVCLHCMRTWRDLYEPGMVIPKRKVA